MAAGPRVADRIRRVLRGAKPTREALLLCRPSRTPGVESARTESGMLLLSPQTQPSGAAAWPWKRARKFELEPVGESVWDCIDGSRTVEAIANSIASRHKLTRLEAESALLAFLETLGRRGLIELRPPKARRKR